MPSPAPLVMTNFDTRIISPGKNLWVEKFATLRVPKAPNCLTHTLVQTQVPQKPQFGVTASLIHSVQPVRWLFDLYCACVLRERGPGNQPNPCSDFQIFANQMALKAALVHNV